MTAFATVPDPSLAVAHGPPLEEEPGIGALTLPGFFLEVTRRHGPSEAIAQPRPGGAVERWSYDDFRERSMEVARALTAGGLGKGARVGILMTNRAEFLSALFGTALAGGTAAPLSTFSTPAELDFLISNAACSVLLIEPDVLKRDFAATLRELEPVLDSARPGEIASAKYPFLTHIAALDREEPSGAIEPWADFLARGSDIADARVEARARSVSPADPAVLMHSSGTTGRPKGILNSQRGVAIQLWRWPRIFGVNEPGRTWSANGLFWSGPFGMAIGSAFATGGTLVMLATFDPARALALIESEKVTQPLGWPHQWAQLPDAPNWNEVDLSSLRYVDPEHVLARHPTVKAEWPEPTRVYGSTETFTLSCGYTSGTSEDILRGAWGFPLPGVTVKIVDPFTGVTLPPGERGELAVKGPTLMLGYIGVPLDETLDDEGFFRTGDGGYLDDEGRVYWEGRINDIIKTGGANVSPVEIDALLIQYPGVKIVQTIGVPDDLLGERVVSLIAPQEGVVLDEDAIRAFAKEQLASYKVPRRILFIAEDDFIQTGSAKVKTEELRELAGERLRAGQALPGSS